MTKVELLDEFSKKLSSLLDHKDRQIAELEDTCSTLTQQFASEKSVLLTEITTLKDRLDALDDYQVISSTLSKIRDLIIPGTTLVIPNDRVQAMLNDGYTVVEQTPNTALMRKAK